MNKFTAITIILILTLFLLQFIIKNIKLKQFLLLGSFILSTGGAILMDTVTTNDYIYSNTLALIFSLINIIVVLPYHTPIKLKFSFTYFYFVLLLTGINLFIFIQNLHPFAQTIYPIIKQ
jgi:hypothetical protein